MPPSNRTEAGSAWARDATNSASRARIVSQAALAAIPFMSDPEDAAVALVFGTFAVSVAVIFTRSGVTPNRAAATCATF